MQQFGRYPEGVCIEEADGDALVRRSVPERRPGAGSLATFIVRRNVRRGCRIAGDQRDVERVVAALKLGQAPQAEPLSSRTRILRGSETDGWVGERLGPMVRSAAVIGAGTPDRGCGRGSHRVQAQPKDAG
jgi:hypothetical protein